MREKSEAEKSAMSIFGFNLYAQISEVEASFTCIPYDGGGWISHKCSSGKRTLFVQANKRKKGEVIVGLKGIQTLSSSEADNEIQRVIGLIGLPDTQNNARDGGYGATKRLVWGEGRLLSDEDRESIYKELFITTYPEKDGAVSFHKSVFSSSKFKSNLSFDWDPALGGVWSLLGWGLFGLVWAFSLKYHSDERRKNPSLWSYLMEVGGILSVSVIITMIIGAGGEVCSSSDMFGCNEYSGDYREPWSISQRLEFFVKICGVILLGWWMALRGYRLTQYW